MSKGQVASELFEGSESSVTIDSSVQKIAREFDAEYQRPSGVHKVLHKSAVLVQAAPVFATGENGVFEVGDSKVYLVRGNEIKFLGQASEVLHYDEEQSVDVDVEEPQDTSYAGDLGSTDWCQSPLISACSFPESSEDDTSREPGSIGLLDDDDAGGMFSDIACFSEAIEGVVEMQSELASESSTEFEPDQAAYADLSAPPAAIDGDASRVRTALCTAQGLWDSKLFPQALRWVRRAAAAAGDAGQTARMVELASCAAALAAVAEHELYLQSTESSQETA